MSQPDEHDEHAVEHVEEGFDAGEVIIDHVANGGFEHPIIHLSPILGIDFSVTKHVFMLWFVATVVFTVITLSTRRYLKQDRMVDSMSALSFPTAMGATSRCKRSVVMSAANGEVWPHPTEPSSAVTLTRHTQGV